MQREINEDADRAQTALQIHCCRRDLQSCHTINKKIGLYIPFLQYRVRLQEMYGDCPSVHHMQVI